MLNQLKIYGYEKIERGLMAGLVTGDPVLLIGRHGTAKTALCRRLAQAMGLRYHAYDASKAMFEDIIGFPDPSSIDKGSISYIPTPLSLWDKEFVLIDEISRAQMSMQNKWLELIRSRTVMGMKQENLKYVFAAMNPITYAGTMEIDEALLGRFAIIIRLPELHEMDAGSIASIMENMTEDDSPMLERSETDAPELNIGMQIESYRKAMDSRKLRKMSSKYVTSTIEILRDNDIQLDGRRLGMMYRHFIAFLAINNVRSTHDNAGIVESIKDMLKYTLPTLEEHSVQLRINAVADEIFRIADSPVSSIMGFDAGNAVSSVRAFISNPSKLSPEARDRFVVRLLDSYEKSKASGSFKDLSSHVNALLMLADSLPKTGDLFTCAQTELIMGKVLGMLHVSETKMEGQIMMQNRIYSESPADLMCSYIAMNLDINGNIDKDLFKILRENLTEVKNENSAH